MLKNHFPSSGYAEEHVNSGHREAAKECGSSEETSSAWNVYDIGHVIDEKSRDISLIMKNMWCSKTIFDQARNMNLKKH